jgi:hypothetical protein
MTERPRRARVEVSSPGPGLRLRLWLACLLAPLAAGGLLGWVVATRGAGLFEPALAWVWVPAVGGLGVLLGLLAALWLDRHVAGHLGGLIRGIADERVADLRTLPSASGWGELSELSQQVQMLLMRHRQAQRSAADLDALLAQLSRLREALERWNRTERWEPLTIEGLTLAPLVGLLNRSLARGQGIRDENADAARQVRDEIHDAVADARESAEQAERGFVESTALLTTVRELHRLGGELTTQLDRLTLTPPASPHAESIETIRATAAGAIGELVDASADSVEHLAAGMLRVQEIADHVQRLANRATLIALNVVAGGPSPESQAEQLKRLARDVREATERTSALAAEVEAEVAAAHERMQRVRGDIATRLESLPSAEPPAPVMAVLPDDAARLLERVREMINDATRKGERLSASGERASRAAQRLSRRLDDEARELDGLIVRLAPVNEPGAAPAPSAPAATPPAAPASAPPAQRATDARSQTGTLRLLGRQGEAGGDVPRSRGEERP